VLDDRPLEDRRLPVLPDEALRERDARLADEPVLRDERLAGATPAFPPLALDPRPLRRPGEVVRARLEGEDADCEAEVRAAGLPACCWISSFRAAMRWPSCSSRSPPSCFCACGNISPSSSST
jgi:hypothetical protein